VNDNSIIFRSSSPSFVHNLGEEKERKTLVFMQNKDRGFEMMFEDVKKEKERKDSE